jgi:hypothetical protein
MKRALKGVRQKYIRTTRKIIIKNGEKHYTEKLLEPIEESHGSEFP